MDNSLSVSESNLIDKCGVTYKTPPNHTVLRSKRKAETDFDLFREDMIIMMKSMLLEQEKELKKITPTLMEIKQTNSSIEQSVAFLAAQNEQFKNKIEQMEIQAKKDQEYITILEDKIEDMQRGSRKANIEIKNVPKLGKETREDLIEMVLCLSKNIDCQILKSDIRDVYRVYGKKQDKSNTPIIVEISSTILKTDILKMSKAYNIKRKEKLCAKNLGLKTNENTPIFVSEQLTAKGARLYFLARDLAKSKAYKYCWTAYGTELSRQLDLWLSKADLTHGPARAIIAPHAGYSYCGACAAFAYRQISPVVVKRIFILGPSHHVWLGGCALSPMDKYKTPLYDLVIDKQIYTELEATRQFEWMKEQTDEDEHSIEMHLPYIAKVMEEYKTGFTIIPILVGSLSTENEAKYGSILAPYLADPQNLFIISSDFCHWGSRFRYTWRDDTHGKIYQSIEWLDKQGMDIIEKMDPRPFTEYLSKYGNTICGRHPIGVLLQAIAKLQNQSNSSRMSLKFLKYAQSSQCINSRDSSVSYASASLVFE